MEDLSRQREESRAVLLKLIGKRVTEAFYDGNEIVLEFDNAYRLQLSPKGLEIQTKQGSSPL